jgi:hypothetical protein
MKINRFVTNLALNILDKNLGEIFILTVQMRKAFAEPVDLRPGEKVGQFSLGSSIVLLFEAPRGLQFPHPPLHKIRYGEHLL